MGALRIQTRRVAFYPTQRVGRNLLDAPLRKKEIKLRPNSAFSIALDPSDARDEVNMDGDDLHMQDNERSELPDDMTQIVDKSFVQQVQAMIEQGARVEGRLGGVEMRLISLVETLELNQGDGDRKSMDLNQRIQLMEAERKDIINETQQLRAERESLISASEEERERSMRERSKYVEEIQQLQQQLNEQKAKTSRYYSLIIKQGRQEDGLDEEKLATEFRDLRYLVVNIVGNYYQSERVGFASRRDPDWHKRWLGRWSKDHPIVRNYRARAGIFETLFEDILGALHFGVDEKLDHYLGDFESAIQRCSRVSSKDVLEWRKRTMSNALALQYSDPLPLQVKGLLWDRLFAISSIRNNVMCKKDLVKLCENACQLALTIRNTTTNYRIIYPKSGDLLDESLMEGIDLDEETPDFNARVGFTLFGGLVRDNPGASGSGNSVVVLEKAQVIKAPQ